MKFSVIAASALAAAALTLSACGSSSVEAIGDNASDAVVDVLSVEELTIDEVWARESPSMADAGAAYMVITSPTDDRLVGASVDGSIAGRAEVHEVVMADGAMDDASGDDEMSDDSTDHSALEGTMTMQQVEAIELPAGGPVALEPGGFHIMLLDLVEPLVAGANFDLTLDFANAGPVTVSVEVRTEAP